ncbi:MAG: ABC transporter permease [Dehalococcoidia bacterium]|nr:ABC transporter permease [Dehalococcoidia bacterium]
MSWARLAAIIRKELIQVRRDRLTLALVVGIPVVELLMFGYALNAVTDHIATVVYDESGTASSREFARAFENSTYFSLVRWVSSRDEAMRAIDSGEAKVALVIPPDFGDRTIAGRLTSAQLIVDGSDPSVAQTALFSGGLVAQAQSGVVTLETLARAGAGAPRGGIELRPVVLYNPRMVSVMFMVPGLIGIILQMQAVLLTALAVVRERERGTLEQLIVSPVRPAELMLGKVLPNVVLCLVSTGLTLLVARVLFGIVPRGSLLDLYVLTLPFLFGSLGIGLAISVVARNQAQALQMTMFTLLPSILLSGFLYAREGMPAIFQAIGLFIPMTYYLQVLRGVIVKGVGLEVLWPQFAALSLFAVLVMTVSLVRFRKTIE